MASSRAWHLVDLAVNILKGELEAGVPGVRDLHVHHDLLRGGAPLEHPDTQHPGRLGAKEQLPDPGTSWRSGQEGRKDRDED